jgi:hypothetical protein
MKRFKEMVLMAPEARPAALKVGTATRPPVSDLHIGFVNKDKVAHLRRKILNPTGMKSSLGSVVRFHKEVDDKFIRKMDLSGDRAHIVMQNDDMMRILNAAQSPMQTDSVEGFILDHDVSGDPNVTISSMFDMDLQKWVPVCISILFGKSALHYEQHWSSVFSCINGIFWDEFMEEFPGNTCDFSDALRIGFTNALKDLFDVDDRDINSLHNFCDVHFQQSRSRVSRNSGIIPSEKEEDFIADVDCLRSFKQGDFLNFEKACFEFFRKHPKATRWLKWYLHPSRAVIFFMHAKS